MSQENKNTLSGLEPCMIDVSVVFSKTDLDLLSVAILKAISDKNFKLLEVIKNSEYFDNDEKIDSFKFKLESLEKFDYVKITNQNLFNEGFSIALRAKGKELFKQENHDSFMSVEEWIDEWRLLFKGKKKGAMGDKKACIKKMNKFMKENPSIDKDLIYKATNMYIEDQAPNYTYLQYADYFISKEGTDKVARSNLSIYCDRIIHNDTEDSVTSTFEERL